MNNYKIDELKGRNKFKELFSKNFKKMWFNPDEFSWFDFSGDSYNKNKILIEIKYREDIKVSTYSANTIIEQHKRDCFTEFHKLHPEYDCYYIVICSDGYMIFDVNSRINNNTSEWLATYQHYCPATTSTDTGSKYKEVAYLRLDIKNNNYNDKFKVNGTK